MGSVLLVTFKATNEEFVLPLKELSDPSREVLQ